jgi:hypothetical protein
MPTVSRTVPALTLSSPLNSTWATSGRSATCTTRVTREAGSPRDRISTDSKFPVAISRRIAVWISGPRSTAPVRRPEVARIAASLTRWLPRTSTESSTALGGCAEGVAGVGSWARAEGVPAPIVRMERRAAPSATLPVRLPNRDITSWMMREP